MTPQEHADLTAEVLGLCRELPLVRRLGPDDPERLTWVDRRRRAVQQLDDPDLFEYSGERIQYAIDVLTRTQAARAEAIAAARKYLADLDAQRVRIAALDAADLLAASLDGDAA